MSHSYYRNPRGRMIKMFIMFGSLCFSAYMLPKTIDKLGESGLGSLLQPGGGVSPETQRLLSEGGLEALLGAEKASTSKGKSGKPMIITPNGEMSEEEYQRLMKQAQRMAPIKVVRGKGAPKPEADPVTAGLPDAALAKENEEMVNQLLELLEGQGG